MKINLKLKIRSPFKWTSKLKSNKINIKINGIDKLYIMEDSNGLYINEDILWPVKLIISAERMVELEELAVNNFYVQRLYSICKYNENRTEIELNLTGVNPMRMFLSLKNKFIFNRINIT
jgi:hypothetical protein